MCKNVTCTAVGVIAAALLGLASCSAGQIDYFGDYRDANLLDDASKGFGGLQVGYQSQAVDVGSYEYATVTRLTAAGEIGSTTGLPDGAEVYRFEIHDLLKNGDFESGDISHWSTTGDGTVSIVDATDTGEHPIEGQSLDFWLSTDQFLTLDLGAPGVVADGFKLGGEYVLNFEFNADPNIASLFFGFSTTAADDVPEDWVAPLSELDKPEYATYEFPEATGRNGRITVPSTPNTARFRIGRDSFQQSGTLDNIRLSRSDIRPYLEISLSQNELDPSRPLVGGSYYEFSIYVKPEAEAVVTPATPGRYRSNGISLWANGEVYSESSDEWPADEWTKVTHRFTLPELSLPEDPDAVAVRLRVSPTLYSDQDAGSLLIAAPELVFNPSEPRNLW